MQQPSSLIFLAIVVIWGAYLLQHWIRRREALATARSVDEFTEAMRVLERRDPLPEGIAKSEDSSHASRPPAPQVSVKQPRPSLRAGTVMTGEAKRPTSDTAPASSPAPAATAKVASAAQTSLRGAQRFGSFAAHAGSPKLRAGALIACVAILLITIICTPFGALPWWSPLLALVVSGGVLWWCRESAKAAAARRQEMAPKRAPRTAVRQTRNVEATPVRARMPKAPAKPAAHQAADSKAPAKMPAEKPAAQRPAARRESVFDVTAAVAPEVPAVSAAPAASADPQQPQQPVAQETTADGWQPVAVPRPTYTMKEKAPQRPEPQPAPTVADQPAPAAASYEHVANEDLPFDGLALDQDLEELPSVYRAG
ncbi:hypothetical protein [Flexivirga meconopsidis]|uniref:hypothetical protein n=1 Tax=Flexivirga meconopsidis TaxID=2977121 RepID=UPI00223ED3FB|nr:hypothetical protein [Flexivirga meconopsidis]